MRTFRGFGALAWLVFLVAGCGGPAVQRGASTAKTQPKADSGELSELVLAKVKDSVVLIGNFEGGTLTSTASSPTGTS
jgi:hypothetical protein